MIALLLNTWSLFVVPAHARCDPNQLETALGAVDQAFAANDAKAMSAAVAQMRKAMACSREPVPPQHCAKIHRARALAAWVEGDEEAVVRWFRGMLHADPRTDLPARIVSERHKLRSLLTVAEERETLWSEGPGKTWLLVDGLRTGAVPTTQPYVVQPIRDDGQTLGARVIDRSRTEGKAKRLGRKAGKRPERTVLRWAGIGLGVVSAGLYGGAWATHGAYDQAVIARDNDRIGSLHTTTNALSIGSVATIGLGTGALISSVVAF